MTSDSPQNDITTRRGFLRQGIGAAVSAWTLAGLSQNSTLAIEPLERGMPSHFKFSLAAYSYRDLLTGNPPRLTLTDFVNDCARFGLEGTELTSYYFPNPVTTDYLRQLRRQCFRLGLDVSGTAVGNDFGHPMGPARVSQIELVKRWIEHAEILGAPVIRIFAGDVPESDSAERAHTRMVGAIQECCEYAGQHGIHLALENHGGPTATADGLLALVRAVDSRWFGVNLDTGNFHTEDIYGDLARVAPYAINVQVKASISGPDGKKQPTDYVRLAKILCDATYRGYVVLEFEDPGDPRELCRTHLDQLRAAFDRSTDPN
jgi:sugar phosphate isomerase/epimerase